MTLRDGPLTLDEIRELTEFAIGFAKEHPTANHVRIAQLILKAAEQKVQVLEEFASGYQVRGELHELSEKAAHAIHDRLKEVEQLTLCEPCRKLVNDTLWNL